MKYIGGILSGIAMIAIPFILFYLEREKPDVVYSLSENIPVSDTENKENSIQQIKVTNIGEVEAKGISVKINREVIDYRIINNSNSDKVEIFTEGPIEILYHQLPPDGTFSVILETNNNFLTGNDISIMSSAGKARNALENENNYLANIIILGIVVIYLIFFISQSRKWRVDSKHRQYINNSEADFGILDKKKPIYFTNNEWEYLVEVFVKNKLIQSYYKFPNELYDDESLQFLKIVDRPQNISEELFRQLKKAAQRTFESKLDTLLPSYSYYQYERIHIIAQKVYEKISSLPSNQEVLLEKLSRNFYKLLINIRITNLEELDRKMKEVRPVYVMDIEWRDYKHHLEDIKLQLVIRENRNTSDKNNLLPLLQSEELLIRELVYSVLLMDKLYRTFVNNQKPLVFNNEEWLEPLDSRILEKTVESINKAEINEEAASSKLEVASLKLRAIKDIIIYNQFNEEEYVDVFKEAELELLKKYETTYKKVQEDKENLSRRTQELMDQEIETSSLMKKLTDQLKVINDLFVDPQSINRVEDYQIPFAQGNFERLKELSVLMSLDE